MTAATLLGTEAKTDTPANDRWLYAWAVGYAAVGGAVAAAAGSFATFSLAAILVLLGGAVGLYATRL